MNMFFKKRKNEQKFNLEVHSYSQCGEDRIIHFACFLLGINKPFYVDVGAYHPEKYNNTNIFYQTGASGINIEPNPNQFQLFEISRPRDINLNVGIGDQNGFLDFFEMSSPTLSTFVKEEAERISEIGTNRINHIYPVQVETFTWLIDNFIKERPVDLLDIDIEGGDSNFFESINFSEFRPKIVCIETINYTENKNERKDYELIEYMKSKNYIHYADTYINSIFIGAEFWKKRKR
jgi:FkbM family methyltransferase